MRTIMFTATLLAIFGIAGCGNGNREAESSKENVEAPKPAPQAPPVKPNPPAVDPGKNSPAPKQSLPGDLATDWAAKAKHTEPTEDADPPKPNPVGSQTPKADPPGVVIPDPPDSGPKKGPLKPEQPPKIDPKPGKTGEEPSLNTPMGGKTIDEWIAAIPSKDPSKSQSAILSVLQFGPKLGKRAIPAIQEILKKPFEYDLSVRVNAVIVLGALLNEDNKPDPEQIRVGALEISFVLKNDQQYIVRYKAAEALAGMGPAAGKVKGVINDLLDAIGDANDWELREASAHALGRVAFDDKNGPPEPVLNKLLERLAKDKAFQVRMTALQSLTALGPPANPMLREALYKALMNVGLKDTEPTCRIWAYMSLMSIKGKIEPEIVKVVAEYADDKDSLTRIQALQALAALGEDAKNEVPRMVKALEDKDKNVAAYGLLALSKMEKYAFPAAAQLKKIVSSKDWPEQLKEMAQKTLDTIDGKTPKKDKDGKGGGN